MGGWRRARGGRVEEEGSGTRGDDERGVGGEGVEGDWRRARGGERVEEGVEEEGSGTKGLREKALRRRG